MLLSTPRQKIIWPPRRVLCLQQQEGITVRITQQVQERPDPSRIQLLGLVHDECVPPIRDGLRCGQEFRQALGPLGVKRVRLSSKMGLRPARFRRASPLSAPPMLPQEV